MKTHQALENWRKVNECVTVKCTAEIKSDLRTLFTNVFTVQQMTEDSVLIALGHLSSYDNSASAMTQERRGVTEDVRMRAEHAQTSSSPGDKTTSLAGGVFSVIGQKQKPAVLLGLTLMTLKEIYSPDRHTQVKNNQPRFAEETHCNNSHATVSQAQPWGLPLNLTADLCVALDCFNVGLRGRRLCRAPSAPPNPRPRLRNGALVFHRTRILFLNIDWTQMLCSFTGHSA